MSAVSLSDQRQALKADVVSVQSQVVYGRVGNNVAVPALEALGLSIAAVPTVVFSNTPHYPTMHGGALPTEWFDGYLQDLAARTLLTGRTQWVAVTSAAPGAWTRDEMQVVLVTRTQAEVIVHPRIDATPKGTGDLFCATLTGHWLNGADLSEAAIQACRHVVYALRHTREMQCAELLLPMADSHNDNKATARECVSKFTYRIFPCKQPLPI